MVRKMVRKKQKVEKTVRLHVTGPKMIIPSPVHADARLDQTWLEVFNGTLKLRLDPEIEYFVCSSKYSVKNPKEGQGFRAELSENIAQFMKNFKNKQGTIWVRLCRPKAISTVTLNQDSTLEANSGTNEAYPELPDTVELTVRGPKWLRTLPATADARLSDTWMEFLNGKLGLKLTSNSGMFVCPTEYTPSFLSEEQGGLAELNDKIGDFILKFGNNRNVIPFRLCDAEDIKNYNRKISEEMLESPPTTAPKPRSLMGPPRPPQPIPGTSFQKPPNQNQNANGLPLPVKTWVQHQNYENRQKRQHEESAAHEPKIIKKVQAPADQLPYGPSWDESSTCDAQSRNVMTWLQRNYDNNGNHMNDERERATVAANGGHQHEEEDFRDAIVERISALPNSFFLLCRDEFKKILMTDANDWAEDVTRQPLLFHMLHRIFEI